MTFGVALIAIIAILSFSSSLRIGGYQPIVITSGSMRPSVDRGDLLIIKDSNDIQVGDLITFRPSTGKVSSVTHRVVGIQNNAEGIQYFTKGDANNTADLEPVPANRVIGVVVRELPNVGYLALVMHNRLLVVLLVFALLLMELTIWLSSHRHTEKHNPTIERKQHETFI